MDFTRLQCRLVTHIRERVRSGELTERGLARMTGVSQPHIHNVLKGQRSLSMETADQILHELHLSLIDLLEESDFSPPNPHT